MAAANKRCVAIRFGGQGKLDEILVKDLGGKEIGSAVTIVGYNNPVGLVRSMSVADNCVLAWGELVTDAAGTSTKAAGRKVTVRWTQGGAPQTKVLPG